MENNQVDAGRDGCVSRDEILRCGRGKGNIHFACSVEREQDWYFYLVDPHSAICDDVKYIHTYIHIVHNTYST